MSVFTHGAQVPSIPTASVSPTYLAFLGTFLVGKTNVSILSKSFSQAVLVLSITVFVICLIDVTETFKWLFLFKNEAASSYEPN